MTTTKVLAAALFLAVLGLLAALAVDWEPDPSLVSPQTPTHEQSQLDAAKGQTPLVPAEKRVDVDAEGPTQEALTRRAIPQGVDDSPQGVTGRIVDAAHRPIGGASVYLVPQLQGFADMRRLQAGERILPTAVAATSPDGSFKLGVAEQRDGKPFELRVVHDDHCEQTVPRIEIQPRDWFDAGTIQLRVGGSISGTVTDESGARIASARIVARTNAGLLLVPTPGREDGIETTTDADGRYEIYHLDPQKTYALGAQADGYAREERSELSCNEQKALRIDFRLVAGLDIAGQVLDPAGQPITDAEVTVAALSQKSRHTETTRTGADGGYRVSGMRAGPYVVMAQASGFQRGEEKPIQAGTDDLVITLERQGTVRVTVLGKGRRPLRNFDCKLKVAIDGQDAFGVAVISREARGAAGGQLVITGIDPMTYVAEVHAKGYAKNFSERFTIDHPFRRFLPTPYTISHKTAVTDAHGEYRLDLLHPGTYQLSLARDGFCGANLPDQEVLAGKTSDAGAVQLTRGCLVTGIARLDGRPAGQIKVHVTAKAAEKNTMGFTTEAVTDSEGRFQLPKRLRPGRYEARAAQSTAGIFGIIVSMQKSKTFVVGRGQAHQAVFLDVTSPK